MTNDYTNKIKDFKSNLEEQIKVAIPNERIEVQVDQFGKRNSENGSIINFNIIKFTKRDEKELGNINIYSWADRHKVKSNFHSDIIKSIFDKLTLSYKELF